MMKQNRSFLKGIQRLAGEGAPGVKALLRDTAGGAALGGSAADQDSALLPLALRPPPVPLRRLELQRPCPWEPPSRLTSMSCHRLVERVTCSCPGCRGGWESSLHSPSGTQDSQGGRGPQTEPECSHGKGRPEDVPGVTLHTVPASSLLLPLLSPPVPQPRGTCSGQSQ